MTLTRITTFTKIPTAKRHDGRNVQLLVPSTGKGNKPLRSTWRVTGGDHGRTRA